MCFVRQVLVAPVFGATGTHINTVSVFFFNVINQFYCVFVTNIMEDDDTFGLFKIWLMDDFRVNGIWKKIAKFGSTQGIGQWCFGKMMSLL